MDCIHYLTCHQHLFLSQSCLYFDVQFNFNIFVVFKELKQFIDNMSLIKETFSAAAAAVEKVCIAMPVGRNLRWGGGLKNCKVFDDVMIL